jgi:hypothetical protein
MEKKNEVKTLFINDEAVNYEMRCLNSTINEARLVKQYLGDRDLLVTPATIIQACNRQFNTIIELSKAPELKEMMDFEAKVGRNEILSEMTMQRINAKANELNAKLLAGLPQMGQFAKHYLKYINFETMEVLPGVKAEFIEKHSIKADAEIVEKHEQLVNSLNYFFTLFPDQDTRHIFERLVRLDVPNRKASLKLDIHDPQKLVLDFVSLRMNDKI